jgi:hypothetical protein
MQLVAAVAMGDPRKPWPGMPKAGIPCTKAMLNIKLIAAEKKETYKGARTTFAAFKKLHVHCANVWPGNVTNITREKS